VEELCIPKVEVTAVDDIDTGRWKGSAQRLAELEAAALAAIRPPNDDVIVPIGVRNHVVTVGDFSAWIETAKRGAAPINDRRAPDRHRQARAGAAHGRRCIVGERGAVEGGDQQGVADAEAGEARRFDPAVPVGAATGVDGRRPTAGRRGERLAQRFAHLSPGGTTGTIADLTIGYRVPEPILSIANRLLPLTRVDTTESRSVRLVGEVPSWIRGDSVGLAARVASATAEVKRLHRLTGVVASERLHGEISIALTRCGLSAVDHVHDLDATEIPLFGPHAVKGLEFDGVVVVNPHEILGPTALGARLLYVAMTRAVQTLVFVTDSDVPPILY